MEDRTGRLGLKRQVFQSLRQVLQLRLQERRSRVELLRQGTMPTLKRSVASLSEQNGILECSRTEDSLRRTTSRGPERPDPTGNLQETPAVPSLQAAGLQQKRARFGGEANKKISRRSAPTFRHILPLPFRIQPAIKETQPPKVSDESCDEDSSCSLSPGLGTNPGALLGLQPSPALQQIRAGSSAAPPAMVGQSQRGFTLTFVQQQCNNQAPPLSSPALGLNLTIGMLAQSVQPAGVLSQTQLSKTKKKPKVKKLKYHQYVHPDQKNNKGLPAPLNQSSGRALHQQQHLLQPQPLKHQLQQKNNLPIILPTLTKPPHSIPSASVPPPHTPSSLPPLRQVGPSSALLGQRNPSGLLPNLDDMRLTELKPELKRQGLAVSGPRNERFECYQKLKRGFRNTSFPTAGGSTRSGAEGGAFIATDSSPAGAPHQFLHYQTFLNLRPAVAQPLAPLSGDDLLPASSCSTSPCTRRPEDSSINILEDVVSPPRAHQPPAVSQHQVSVKEEPSPFARTPCPFSGRKRKHCPKAAVDKDKLLQEKDLQIQELTKQLKQKEHLVEMLRFQLEMKTNGGLPEPMVHVKVKQEPPDRCSSSPSLIHPPSPPFTPTVELVAVKQEVIKEEVVSQTSLGSPQCAPTEHPCQFSQQQRTQKLLPPQECDIQEEERTNENRDRTLEDLPNHFEQQRKREIRQQNPDVTEQQQTPKVYQICLYPLEVLKSKAAPTLVTKGNDFLIAANQISLQRLQSAAELPGNHLAELRQKAVERDGGLVEVILQSGASKLSTDPLDYLKPASPGSAPPSSPLQLALSPVTSPRLNVTPARSERQIRVDATEEHRCPSGRMEDFFESTIEEGLLEEEPDGLLSLIDDLRSRMCAPSISGHPPSRRNASSSGTEEEHDLDLSVGAATFEDQSTLGPLGPQPPSSVFSADLLDSFDLQILTV